jgi:protein gp37
MFTRFHKSFEPTFYPERLNEPSKLKKPSKIFCCSVADIFADWTKPEWRETVLKEIEKYPQHIFQLLTKQPQNIKLKPMENVWVGATITCDNEMDKLYSLVNNYEGMKFLSFEPLLSPVKFMQTDGYIDKIDWIIIGKLTGSRKVPLDKEAVRYIIREARSRNIPIFIKNNIGWEEKIQEFPKSAKPKEAEA